MRGWLLTLLVAVALFALVAKPVTATTVDRNGTEIKGTCGPLWSMLAGDEPAYDDAAATDGTDIGVFKDPDVVRRACRANANSRVGLGVGVVGAVVVFERVLSRRRASASQTESPSER